jgi:hypothetical protein
VSGARDSVMLFSEGDATVSTDDQWVSGLPISSVGTGTCSSTFGSRSGLRLGTTLAFNTALYAEGAPFRTYEVMVYKLYQSGSKYYLGAYSHSASENHPTYARPTHEQRVPLGLLRRDRHHRDGRFPKTSAPSRSRSSASPTSESRVAEPGSRRSRTTASSPYVTLRNALR